MEEKIPQTLQNEEPKDTTDDLRPNAFPTSAHVLGKLPRKKAIFLSMILLLLLGAITVYSFYQSTNTRINQPSQSNISTTTPNPTISLESTRQTTLVPTLMPSSTPNPTSSASNKSDNSNTTNSSSNSPTPNDSNALDTTPPIIVSMTGPENGSTVDFKGFCFPLYTTDNVSKGDDLQTRYKFDNSDWSNWGSNYSPCYSDVANGQHTFTIEVKDKAGNTTSTSRSFTVQAS